MRWTEHPPLPAPPLLPDLHPLVAQTLFQRGIRTPAAAQSFLDHNAYTPAPASALPGMDAACTRIAAAIHRRERICIWGDFDVDGQTATALLVQTLTALGADLTYHIPIRETEGHGIKPAFLAEIIDQGARLIVTCDTGITAHEAVNYARTRGVDVVITDHHDLGESLPPAAAITNPKLLPQKHPLANLAGVGVAYKLAEALLTTHFPNASLQPSSLLDLTAMGLVADLALLRGDTRYLVQRGLQQLRQTERAGLKAMFELAELKAENLTESHIGFALGPRLNALGRLGDANPAVELLTTADPMRARVLAAQLEGLNAQRQLLTSQVTQAAEAQLRAEPALLAQPVIVLAHPGWPGGIVGIAAARIVERYGKPTILLSIGEDGIARGSARSIEGVHITEAIAAQKDLLLNYGGHPMAAGLSLPAQNLPEFRKRISKTVEKMLGEAVYEEGQLTIDGWLSLADISLDLTEQIERLAPFGPGNEKLVLATRNLTLQGATPIGRGGEHVKLTVSDETGLTQTVLWWGGGSEDLPNGRFDLAYTLRASDFRGQRQVSVELVDFRITDERPVTVRPTKIEVVDLRQRPNDPAALRAAFDTPLIWAEGPHKKETGGLSRYELRPAETLVIWTAPPTPADLRAALAAVQPRRVILVCSDPGIDEPRAFLERLAGLVKFVLSQHNGQTQLPALAAATAQSEAAVLAGLDWLVKRGQISVQAESDGALRLGQASAPGDEAAARQVIARIQFLLAESAAYRAYLLRAEAERVLP